MYCTKCGKENSENNNYCYNCGEKLSKEKVFSSNYDYNDYIFSSNKFKEQKSVKKYYLGLSNNFNKSSFIVTIIVMIIMIGIFIGFSFSMGKTFPMIPMIAMIPILVVFSIFIIIFIAVYIKTARNSVSVSSSKNALLYGNPSRAIITKKYDRRNRYGVCYFFIEYEYLINEIKYTTVQELSSNDYSNLFEGQVIDIKTYNNIGVLSK